jgi:hypothetical protein
MLSENIRLNRKYYPRDVTNKHETSSWQTRVKWWKNRRAEAKKNKNKKIKRQPQTKKKKPPTYISIALFLLRSRVVEVIKASNSDSKYHAEVRP